MPANPAITTAGTGRGNTVVSPQPGMLIQPIVIADTSGNVSAVTSTSAVNVIPGSINAFTTLNAVTANTTGTTADAGAAQSNWTGIAVATGSPTAGTITLELSVDGTTWVSSTSTNSIPAAGTYAVFSTGKPARYARVSLTGLAGTITLTVKMMAAG